MLTNKKNLITISIISTLVLSNCTDLEDKVLSKPIDNTPPAAPGAAPKGDAANALRSAYARLNDFSDQANIYAMEEHPSDEMMGPTRGTDWGDNGTWRQLHLHTWTPEHAHVITSWDNLNNAVFRAIQTDYFASASQTQIKAEARFLKAFYSYFIVDLYGQLPSTNLLNTAEKPKISTRSAAVDTLIKDLDYSIANMTTTLATNANPYTSKQAAQFLLAKVYLNKAVYKQDPNKPEGPYTFAKADMDKVIELCNAIISSGKYQLTSTYFDNFHWENDTRSKELIFAVSNNDGSPNANVRNRYYMGLHYNQKPSGWNGFTTLADFYKSFEANDQRLGGSYPGVTNVIGLRTGFLVGQQFDGSGAKLKTRGGKDLIFTPEINIQAAAEEAGVRVVKYVPKPDNLDNPGHDYVFFRYADVLLMKAEAILRGGTDPQAQTALQLVNNLRSARKASTLTTVDLNTLLAERGRELYYEGWRRSDQIRFEKFITPVEQRPNASPGFRVVFPLPQKIVDINPTWKQNVGY